MLIQEKDLLRELLEEEKFTETDESLLKDIYLNVKIILEGDSLIAKSLPENLYFFITFLKDYERYQEKELNLEAFKDRYIFKMLGKNIITHHIPN